MPSSPSQTLLLEKDPWADDILICDYVIKILTYAKSCKIDKRVCIVNRSLKALSRWFVCERGMGSAKKWQTDGLGVKDRQGNLEELRM